MQNELQLIFEAVVPPYAVFSTSLPLSFHYKILVHSGINLSCHSKEIQGDHHFPATPCFRKGGRPPDKNSSLVPSISWPIQGVILKYKIHGSQNSRSTTKALVIIFRKIQSVYLAYTPVGDPCPVYYIGTFRGN